MKFKKTHTVDQMINSAMKEDDGYFEVATNDGDVLSVTITRPPRTILGAHKIVWRHQTPSMRVPAVITRSGAMRILEAWRQK